MYPLMRGSDFHTCNGAAGTGCPGNCHNCTMLPGGFTLGLCCPLSRRECLRYHSSSASVSGTSFTGGAGGAGFTGGMGGAGAIYPGMTGRMGGAGAMYPGLTGGAGSAAVMYPGMTPGAGSAGPISPSMGPGSFLPVGGFDRLRGGAVSAGAGISPAGGGVIPGSGFRPIGSGMPPGGGMPPTGEGRVAPTDVRIPPVAGGPLPPGAIRPGPGFRPIGPGMSGPMMPTSGACFGTTPPLGVCIGPMEICPPYARCVTGIGGRRICCPMGPTIFRGPIGSPLMVPGYPRRRPGMR